MDIQNKSLVELKSLKSHLEFEVNRKIYAQKQIDKLDTNFDNDKNIDKKELLRIRLDTMVILDMINDSDFEEICELAKYNRSLEELKLQSELVDLHSVINSPFKE